MPAPKRRAPPAANRAARPAAKRTAPKVAKLTGLFPPIPTAAMVVPTCAPGCMGISSLGAWKLPVAVKGKPAASGVVYLRGAVGREPGAGPANGPALFTLPAGMRPAEQAFALGVFRDQGPAPYEPVVLSISPSGTVGALGRALSADSLIWVDGVSFTAA